MSHTQRCIAVAAIATAACALGATTSSSPSDDLLPVTIVAVDAETGRPIRDFSYYYWIEPGTPPPCEPQETEVHSEDGSITLRAPRSCQLCISLTAPEYLDHHGFPGSSCFDLLSGDTTRRLTLKLTRGYTVRGLVRDAATGKAIAGAMVYPVVFTPPLFTPDERRAVQADENGRFVLRGVGSMGIEVHHPSYNDANVGYDEKVWNMTPDGTGTIEVELTSGETLHGIVRDVQGRPVGDVKVEDGAGKTVYTAPDGTFVLQSPDKWYSTDAGPSYYISVEKEGYVEQTLHPTTVPAEGLTVELKGLPRLMGQVVDAAGKPVSSYSVAAGPGEEPQDFECSEKEIDDPQGRFSLTVNEEGKTWIGVKAPGCAFAETWIIAGQKNEPVKIALGEGTFVAGSAKPPQSARAIITARLVPEMVSAGGDRINNELTVRQRMATLDAKSDAAGSFRFEHVLPGRYVLHLFGRAVSPAERALQVPPSGLQVPAVALQGTGSIAGRIFFPPHWREDAGKPWRFKEGEVLFSSNDQQEHLRPLRFTADEKGRFRVDGVPAGQVSVSVPYMASADIINSFSRVAKVFEGRRTEVRFFDPGGEWDMPVQVTVGDGSPEQLRSGAAATTQEAADWPLSDAPDVELRVTPLDDDTLSYPVNEYIDLAVRRRQFVPDVAPGKYSLRVVHGRDDRVLYKTEIDFTPGMPPILIQLPSGSVTGRVVPPKGSPDGTKCFVVDTSRPGALSAVFADRGGRFRFPFLRPATYEVYAHHRDGGWCRVPGINVGAASQDTGEHRLRPGQSILVKVNIAPDGQRPDELYAVDEHGIAVFVPEFRLNGGKDCTVQNLWPGKWTLVLKKDSKDLAQTSVQLGDSEGAEVELNVK